MRRGCERGAKSPAIRLSEREKKEHVLFITITVPACVFSLTLCQTSGAENSDETSVFFPRNHVMPDSRVQGKTGADVVSRFRTQGLALSIRPACQSSGRLRMGSCSGASAQYFSLTFFHRKRTLLSVATGD